MQYFVITKNHSWGTSPKSLAEAIANARASQTTRQETYAEYLECCLLEDETDKVEEYIREGKRAWADHLENQKYENPLEIVVFAVSDEWKLDEVCGLSGNPSWVPKEEGANPEFKCLKLYLVLNPDGTIATRPNPNKKK